MLIAGAWPKARARALQPRCNGTAMAPCDAGHRRGRRRRHAGEIAGRRGVRRARRASRSATRSSATGEPTVVLTPTWPIVALPGVEGAGALPGPALPGGDHRPARQRPLGPADRPGRVHRLEAFAGRPARGDGRGRASTRPCWSDCAPARGRRAAAAAPPPRAGARAWSLRSPIAPCADPAAAGAGRARFAGRAGHRRGLGEVQPPLLAARLARLRRVLLRQLLLRAALDQAARGRGRLGAADHTRGR